MAEGGSQVGSFWVDIAMSDLSLNCFWRMPLNSLRASNPCISGWMLRLLPMLAVTKIAAA